VAFTLGVQQEKTILLYCNFSESNRYTHMNKNKKKLIEARQKCMDAKVGETIVCPSCGTEHVKKSYQSVFCKTKGKTKCKDNYWNNVDPSKRNNTTRISPANASYYASVIVPNEARKRGFPDVESMREHELNDDGSWDAHQCTVGICDVCDLRYDYCRCGEGLDEY